jgi:hypothetical protein
LSFESLSSKPLHFFDIPEVKSLSVSFSYNFFVPDERIDESGNDALNGNLSERFLRKGTADTTNLNARVPRYVKLDFFIGDSRKRVRGTKSVSSSLKSTREEITKALNEGLFVTEDSASTGRFKSMVLTSESIEKDLDTLMRLSLGKFVNAADDVSVKDALISFSRTTGVSSNLVSRMTPPTLNSRPDNKKFSPFATEEKKKTSSVQLNAAYAPMVLRTAFDTGRSLSRDDVLSRFASYSRAMVESKEMLVTEDEGILDIPAADLEKANNDLFIPEVSVIGVLFEKYRIIGNKRYPMPSVVYVGSDPRTAYDSKVAYGQTYEYSATTLAKARIPVTTDDGRTYIQTIFIASKPTKPSQITISEDRAPEPPQDVNYYFNFGEDNLRITWSPPVNPQRDVKYIQIYRRSSIHEPFQLIANLDFDDSVLRTDPTESIDEGLIRSHSSMPTYFIDTEFDRSSSYIYSLVAVDARLISSPYSTQTLVYFDTHKNKVQKRLVSYSGAPKQYPNWMLKENFFVDSMKDSAHSEVNIYFNPEAYTLLRGNGESFPAFYSKSVDPFAKYVFQFMNTDRLLEKKLEVTINDDIYKTVIESSEEGEEDSDE